MSQSLRSFDIVLSAEACDTVIVFRTLVELIVYLDHRLHLPPFNSAFHRSGTLVVFRGNGRVDVKGKPCVQAVAQPK
ncbi:hypothetical protein AOLI_G00167490 [Acnodon oligacanthus]